MLLALPFYRPFLSSIVIFDICSTSCLFLGLMMRTLSCPPCWHRPIFAIHNGYYVCHNNHTNHTHNGYYVCNLPTLVSGEILYAVLTILDFQVLIYFSCHAGTLSLQIFVINEQSKYKVATSPVASPSADGHGELPCWDSSTQRNWQGISKRYLIRLYTDINQVWKPWNKSDNTLAQADQCKFLWWGLGLSLSDWLGWRLPKSVPSASQTAYFQCSTAHERGNTIEHASSAVYGLSAEWKS